MLVKQIYAIAGHGQRVVLKDASDDHIFFAGDFDSFPYLYADYIVDSIRAVGNALVIYIFD